MKTKIITWNADLDISERKDLTNLQPIEGSQLSEEIELICLTYRASPSELKHGDRYAVIVARKELAQRITKQLPPIEAIGLLEISSNELQEWISADTTPKIDAPNIMDKIDKAKDPKLTTAAYLLSEGFSISHAREKAGYKTTGILKGMIDRAGGRDGFIHKHLFS